MSFLESPEQTAQNYDRLAALPAANPADFTPGIFEGMGDAIAKVPQAIGARGALAITETATPLLEKAAHDFGGRFAQPVTDYLERQVAIKRQNALDTLPDPNTTGTAAQIAFGVGVQLPEIVAASIGSGTVAGGVAYEAWVTHAMRKAQLEAQGVDHDTADMMAALEGGIAGGSALLPGVVGRLPGNLAARLPYQMATQAAINVPVGVASRAASASILEARGYPEMAAQIHPFAAAEIGTDALVAAALGPLGLAFHGGPTADALMALNHGGHAAFDTAPGIHVDVNGLNAHIDALTKATEDLLSGRPVDVSGIPLEGEYLPADRAGSTPGEGGGRGATVEGSLVRPALPAPVRLLPRPPEIEAELRNATDDANAELELYRQDIQAGRHEDIEAMPIEPRPGDEPTPPRPEVPALPKRDRINVEPERDSLSTAIAKLGGLNLDEVGREWGEQVTDARKELNAMAWANGGPFGRHVLHRNGRHIDDMVEALTERGYLTPDEHGKGDVNELNDRLQAEIMGERQLTPEGVEWQAERDDLLARADFDESDLTAGGYDELAPAEQVEFERWAAYADDLEAADDEIQRSVTPDSGAVPSGNGAPGRGRPAEGAQRAEGGESLQALARGRPASAEEPGHVEAPRDRDRYTEDLFGQALPETTGAGTPGRPAEGGDVHAAPAVPVHEFDPGVFAAVVAHQTVAHARIGVERVGSIEDAAHVFAYLRKFPQEHFAILTVDSNGRPLEIVRHTQGLMAQTSVELSTLLGTAMRDPRTAEVWTAHNHPSGTAELSSADRMLNNAIRRSLSLGTVKYRGLFAIAGRKFVHNVEGGGSHDDTTGDIPARVRKFPLAIVDRVYRKAGVMVDAAMTNPVAAHLIAERIGKGAEGVLLTNVQMRPVAWLPMSSTDMAKIQGGSISPRGRAAFAHIMRGLEGSNASGMFIVTHESFDSALTRPTLSAMKDVADRAGVRLLDAFSLAGKKGDTASSRGLMEPKPGEKAPDDDLLSTYTNPDVLKRERDRIAAVQAEASALEEQKRRALADAQREAFALTGSDRPADQNPSGQDTLFEPEAVYPGTVDRPMPIDTALAAADERVREADANAEKATRAAVSCAMTEGDG